MKYILVLLLAVSASTFAAAPSYRIVDTIAIGGEPRWDFIYVDSIHHRLYVSHGTQTEVIDTQTDKRVGTISDTVGVHGIAIADALGLGFTSNGKDNSVAVFNLDSLKRLATIAVGTNPDAIVYDPATQRVITFNGRSKDATVIDANRLAVIGTVAIGGKPEVAAMGKGGNVYFNIEDTKEVAALNPKALTIAQRYSIQACESPSGLAIDRQYRVYSVCDNKLLVVTTPEGKVVGQAPIGAGPDGVAWLDGYAFSANGLDGTISVVGETSAGKFEAVATIATQPGARTITADEMTHKLYLPTADLQPASADGKRHGIADTFRVLVLEKQ
jgi:DNA-binding beta-propeller fold protein YncE